MRDYIKLSSEEYNSLITEVSNLRRARDLWRTALESISAYIFITDLNGNIILQNRILESFNSNHIEDLIPSEINWKANGSYELELLGKWVTLLISDTRFKFPGKTIVISDISILKETQQELQNMQKKLLENSKQEINKLSLAVEQCPAEIVISNTNGIIEYVNPFFEEVTGYSFDDAIEHPTKILKSNYHNSNFYNKLWDTITSGNKWSGELLNRDKNGHLYWERASISPLINQQGIITNYIKIAEDITEQKKSETELIKSKKIAEAANNAKNEFLASMSHEIRTPLNGIMGLASTLLRYLNKNDSNWGKLTPKILEQNLKGILSSSELLNSLITDILDISKIEANQMDTNITEINLAEIFDETSSGLYSLAESKNIILDLSVDSDLKIFADKSKFYQVITNVVGNAIKFTHSGFVKISANTDEEFVIISIKDSGIGISKENLEKIFNRFSRIDKTGIIPGTGLGLPIAKKLVEIMDGSIWVESVINQGTTFYLKFRKA